MTRKIKAIVAEAVIVVVVGLGLALVANALSPRGLALSRDYFPRGTNQPSTKASPAPLASAAPSTNEPSEDEQVSQRLKDKGLQEVKLSQVESLLHDPGFKEGRIVLVDARDEDTFQEGHIPGAHELNPYHPEKEIAAVLPLCQAADKVVVYCTGGECEDADTTALLLKDGGVSAQKLFVYGGGFKEWEAQHKPVETSAGGSGSQTTPK